MIWSRWAISGSAIRKIWCGGRDFGSGGKLKRSRYPWALCQDSVYAQSEVHADRQRGHRPERGQGTVVRGQKARFVPEPNLRAVRRYLVLPEQASSNHERHKKTRNCHPDVGGICSCSFVFFVVLGESNPPNNAKIIQDCLRAQARSPTMTSTRKTDKPRSQLPELIGWRSKLAAW